MAKKWPSYKALLSTARRNAAALDNLIEGMVDAELAYEEKVNDRVRRLERQIEELKAENKQLRKAAKDG